MTKLNKSQQNLALARFAFPHVNWHLVNGRIVNRLPSTPLNKLRHEEFDISRPRDLSKVTEKLERDFGWKIRKTKTGWEARKHGLSHAMPDLAQLLVLVVEGLGK